MRSRRSTRFGGITMRIILTELSRASALRIRSGSEGHRGLTLVVDQETRAPQSGQLLKSEMVRFRGGRCVHPLAGWRCDRTSKLIAITLALLRSLTAAA